MTTNPPLPARDRPRLLIFIVAYEAATTLRAVLDRVPRSLFADFDCEILIVDDASTDRTAEVGRAYRGVSGEVRITCLRNLVNQGYGGNQKVGYTYAIRNRFAFVAMVHGDGQYAPEALPRLLEPLLSNQADAVFGSRMMERGAALRGGMPLYKYIGNKILTAVQNAILRTRLSEFHSGYRVYRVATLARLPLRMNADDFHFDTEIILQLLDARARICELPIPTYYGTEISRVNGMLYARNVVRSTLQYGAHRAGLLYQRRYDTQSRPAYDLKLGFPSSHTYALAAVPDGSSVLDLGGGPGGVADLLAQRGCSVLVVDQTPQPPSSASASLIRVHAQSLDEPLDFDVRPYDHLLLLDVIEHLKDPERFLERLRRQLDYQPRTIILTTPNVAFVLVRVALLFGQFNYGKAGILDRTHTRLFTFRSMQRLLDESGFRITSVRGVPAPFPKALGDHAFARALVKGNQALIRLSRTLFSYQIFIQAQAKPDVDFVLSDGQAHAAAATARPVPPEDAR